MSGACPILTYCMALSRPTQYAVLAYDLVPYRPTKCAVLTYGVVLPGIERRRPVTWRRPRASRYT
eukprot:3517727-Rhodomonas_salina.2